MTGIKLENYNQCPKCGNRTLPRLTLRSTGVCCQNPECRWVFGRPTRDSLSWYGNPEFQMPPFELEPTRKKRIGMSI